jgi:hypothetical protein
MKICPTCREEYENQFSYCTFDGIKLKKMPKQKLPKPSRVKSKPANAKPVVTLSSRPVPRGNFRKIGLYALLGVVFLGSSLLAVYTLVRKDSKSEPPLKVVEAASQPSTVEEPPPSEEIKPSMILAEMPREQLLNLLPQNLLRRFHGGERSQGKPDDMRVIKGEKGEYVVLIGSSGPDRESRTASSRILVFQYDGQQFIEVTGSLLPQPLSRGVIAGLRSELRFNSESPNLVARVVASSGSLVSECSTCERAYQQIDFEWNGSRYVESKRAWNNDPYTAFYVTAEALDRKRVDGRARLFVDESLAGEIYLGLGRNSNQPWSVQQFGDSDAADKASYELSNGTDRLIINLSKENERWKATGIDRKGSVN